MSCSSEKQSARKLLYKKHSEQNRLSYPKERNNCVSLWRKIKKDNYTNLNEGIADYKQFWRTVKPLLSDKTKPSEKINLVEEETITL